MSRLNYENRLVLALVQVLVGSVSQNFRRVSLASEEDGVRLAFVLLEDSAEDREEIADIRARFEALTDTPTPVAIEVLVANEKIRSIPIIGRVVFGRKWMVGDDDEDWWAP